jgi:hypothetical protein
VKNLTLLVQQPEQPERLQQELQEQQLRQQLAEQPERLQQQERQQQELQRQQPERLLLSCRRRRERWQKPGPVRLRGYGSLQTPMG